MVEKAYIKNQLVSSSNDNTIIRSKRHKLKLYQKIS